MNTSLRRYESLAGTDKAAALLMSLPAEESANVLRWINETQLERVTSRLLSFDQLSAEAIETLLREAHDLITAQQYVAAGGVEYARSVLNQALGAQRADEILGRLIAKLQSQPFHYLAGVEPAQIATFLQDEHPQIIALVLSYLRAEQTAAVLALLPERLLPQVSLRLAMMGTIDPSIVAQVEAAFRKKFTAVLESENRSKTGGVEYLVRVLSLVDRGAERAILDQLELSAPDLAAEIKRQMFVFENLTQLDDRAMQRILRDVDTRDLALALRGAAPAVREHVFRNMSQRAAATVQEDIESSPPVRMRMIEEAQQRVVDVVRRLEESEEIVVARGSDDVLL